MRIKSKKHIQNLLSYGFQFQGSVSSPYSLKILENPSFLMFSGSVVGTIGIKWVNDKVN